VIYPLLEKLEDCSIRHVYYESNMATDHLANHKIEQKEAIIVSNLSEAWGALNKILVEDKTEVPVQMAK